ncbi:MAG: hypothetical protein RLZZ200_1887 [Pseudomonadota bacterium]|jgi:hypothetical protein
MAESQTTGSALFYTDPQPVTLETHRHWRLRDGDVSFTKDSLGIPLVVSEFVDAARYYPVLFAGGDDGGPLAMTGVDTGNLFLQGALWEAGIYIPAYVRRHPFILIGMKPGPNPEDLALGVDAGSSRWITAEGETDGAPLFEGDEPSQLTKDALQFCSLYTSEAQSTQEFLKALRAKGLMVNRKLDFTLPGDKKYSVDGFQIIDSQKLTDLDGKTLIDWHRKGWLAACYAHLQSLNRVDDLLGRRARQEAPAA